MTTYAGPPVFPQYFVDPLGKPLRSVKITVYERGTDTKPDLYADRGKSTPLGNPFWATSLGNAEFRVDAVGEFEAEVNGVRIPFTVVADPEEPVSIGAGVIEEAMLEFGVATQVELDAVAAAAAAGDSSLSSAVEAVQEALAGKATPAQIDAAIAALSGTYAGTETPGTPMVAANGQRFGTTVGLSSEVGNAIEVDFLTPWGMTDDGEPYYDVTGAAAGEEAVLRVDDLGRLEVLRLDLDAPDAASVPYVPVTGTYSAVTDIVRTAQLPGEDFARLYETAEGTRYLSDGTYAPKRYQFVSSKVSGASTTPAMQTVLGVEAGEFATSYKTTCIGYRAGRVAGRSVTAIGSNALENYLGFESAAVGFNALGAVTTGNFNTAVGGHAGERLIDGHRNCFFGDEAGGEVVSGDDCTYIGFYSGFASGEYMPTPQGYGIRDSTDSIFIGAYNGNQVFGVEVDNVLVLGNRSFVGADYAGTVGNYTSALASGAWAIGVDNAGTGATTSTANEIKLGTPLHTVHAGKDIRTAQGSLAGAGKWRLGQLVVADVVGGDSDVDIFDGYLEVEVDGAIVKLLVAA